MAKKPTAEKSTTENPHTRVENDRFLSRRWQVSLLSQSQLGKYGIQSINAMAFKRTVTLREFSISRHQIRCAHAIYHSADARMRTQNALLFHYTKWYVSS